jgi:hypothetical protein
VSLNNKYQNLVSRRWISMYFCFELYFDNVGLYLADILMQFSVCFNARVKPLCNLKLWSAAICSGPFAQFLWNEHAARLHVPSSCMLPEWLLVLTVFFFKWLMVNEKFYIMCYTDLISTGMFHLKQFFVWWTSSKVHQPFNAGIKSVRTTLPDKIFYWGFCFLNCVFC